MNKFSLLQCIILFNTIFLSLLPVCLEKDVQVFKKSSILHLNLYVRYSTGISSNFSLCHPTIIVLCIIDPSEPFIVKGSKYKSIVTRVRESGYRGRTQMQTEEAVG